jgi:hypothetical protein
MISIQITVPETNHEWCLCGLVLFCNFFFKTNVTKDNGLIDLDKPLHISYITMFLL